MTGEITQLAESGFFAWATLNLDEDSVVESNIYCVCVPHVESCSDFIIGRKWFPGSL